MFTRKPVYSPSELAQQLKDIQTLMALRERLYSDARLLKQKDPSEADIRMAEATRTTMAIKSAQMCYIKMSEKLNRR